MNNIIKKVKTQALKLVLRVQRTVYNEEGFAEIVAVIFLMAVAIILIVNIFFPEAKEMFSGAFDGFGGHLDNILNNKG